MKNRNHNIMISTYVIIISTSSFVLIKMIIIQLVILYPNVINMKNTNKVLIIK